jgi:hypothetical protein
VSKNEKKPRLVLASSSPFRRQLLAQLQVPFTVVVPDIDETVRAQEEAQGLVERLATEKAHVVGAHLSDSLIIGSDQVALYDGKSLGNRVIMLPQSNNYWPHPAKRSVYIQGLPSSTPTPGLFDHG